MNKKFIGIGVLSLVVLTLGLAGFAYAQGQPPQGREYPYGPDMMGGFGGYGMGGNGPKSSFNNGQGQTSTPDEYPYGPDMMDGYNGYGMMGGGYGMMGSGMMGWNGQEGPMHEVMIDSLAQNLNLTPEEIETRHDAGETILEIARAEGLSNEEIRDLMFSVHDTVLEKAVNDGWLTQDQADWMVEHMNQMWGGDYAHCGNNTWNGAGVGWHGMGW